jgi:AraC-like DNA-binding protein
MHQERSAPTLPGAVLWTSRPGPGATGAARVLPDGCMDLIWKDGVLLVAGPDRTAQLVPRTPGEEYTGLRFAPGTGPALLGVTAHELLDLRVPLDQLWPARAARILADRVGDAADRAAALEHAALGRPGALEPPPDRVRQGLLTALRQGAGVAEAARTVGLSDRQLHRRCLTDFGYGPKTLARVLRLGRALELARGGLPFALVAAGAGYADQPHLAREVRALAGLPLRDLLHEPADGGSGG